MASAPVDYAVQPYTGMDLIAIVLAITALHCLVIRLRDREPGLGHVAAGLAGLALWAAANRWHLPSGPALNPSPWYYLMCATTALLAYGLVVYLGLPMRQRRWALAGVVVPALAFAVMTAWVQWRGITVSRAWLHGLTGLLYVSLGVAALQAAKREPGAGHTWLAAALLTVPGLAVALLVTGVDAVAMRYWAAVPLMLVGLTLPTISVMRRQRALQAEVGRRARAEQALLALNATLEARVADRTADLQSMVAGLETFNRSVSHDLQGPLGGIAGLAKLADQALSNGDASVARKALPVIAKQADTSTMLVASLLELARVGDARLQTQHIDPATIAHEVIDQLRLKPGAAQMPHFVVSSLPKVHADPALLRAVLSNLIGNAVKFTRDRQDGLVEIGSGPVNGQVCLQVRDNGIGFDPQAASAVFSPFHRLHDASYAGHGIGLSIVRRAVERHGGRVWAETSPGQGTCFSFTLPKAG